MDLGGGETVHCRTFFLLVPKMHVFSWKIYANYPNHLKSLNPFQNLLSKLVRCTRNCNACSWHWSKQRAQYSTTSDRMSHNQCFKSWTNWAMKFCLIHHIHLISRQLTTTSSSIWTTFCRENASTPSRRQKMLSKSSSNPEAQIFILH